MAIREREHLAKPALPANSALVVLGSVLVPNLVGIHNQGLLTILIMISMLRGAVGVQSSAAATRLCCMYAHAGNPHSHRMGLRRKDKGPFPYFTK